MSSHMFETRDPLPHEMYGCVCTCKGEGGAARGAQRDAHAGESFSGAGLGLTAAIAAIAALAIGTTAAVAQKIQDRHPAMVVDTFEQRWRGDPPRPLTFEERWEGVRQLMVRQSFRTAQTPAVAERPSAGSVEPLRERPVRTVPMRAVLAVPAQPAAAGPVQQTCVRHRLRTVWYGQRWRCRR